MMRDFDSACGKPSDEPSRSRKNVDLPRGILVTFKLDASTGFTEGENCILGPKENCEYVYKVSVECKASAVTYLKLSCLTSVSQAALRLSSEWQSDIEELSPFSESSARRSNSKG